MADELTDRVAVATLLLDASIALDDIARRLATTGTGRQELSAELTGWAERLAGGSDVAMDRMLSLARRTSVRCAPWSMPSRPARDTSIGRWPPVPSPTSRHGSPARR